MSLTKDQVSIIKATAPVLEEHGKTITTLFYATILEENPDLNNIFNHTNQANNHQPASLAASLHAYASFIDDLGVLSPAVERICQKHASLYIQPEHYDAVGTYLLRAMGEVLGAALTPEILEAWTAAYWQLAKIMINREADLMTQTNGWTSWRDFRIAKKVPESSEITSIYLEPVDGKQLPAFLPGQYISVMTYVPEFKYNQPRQYSLSDAPNQSYYRISVKREPATSSTNGDKFPAGYISNLLHADKQEGDILQVSHPFGEFFCDVAKTENPLVLLSAGVGLTPMISILNTAVAQAQSSRKISFLTAARNSDVQAFAQHIKTAVQNHDNISAVVFNSKPSDDAIRGVDYKFKSRMDLDVVDSEADLLLGDETTGYYICGPDKFMADMSDKLREKGVAAERIHMEVFGTGDRK